jgi:chitodextrinase
MATKLLRLVPAGAGLALLSSGASAATIPQTSHWVDRGPVIDTGPHGQAWDVLMEGITPCALVERGSTFYLYYVGSPDYIDDPANVGPRDRAIGVATSTDLVRWSKHAGNPVIEWTDSGNPEEGAPSAGVHLDPSGDVVAYYGANSSGSPTSSIVWADVRLATSGDGLAFVDQGLVVNHASASVYGHGDELHANIAFENAGTWYAYYIPNGTPQQGTLGVAHGSSRGSLTTSTGVSSGGGSVRARGPASIVPIGSGNLAFFIGYGSAMDVRTTTSSALTELSAPVATYSGLPGFGRVVYLDSARKTWFMLYNSWTHIGLMTAPLDGVTDSSPPTAPSGASATPVRHDTVDLSWGPASDPDTGVLEYRVYREGVLVATTRGLAHRDTGLAELTAYTYEVRAVNLHGTLGPPSALVETTPADTTPPVLQAITAGAGQLRVVFDEPVEAASAETAVHYQVPGVAVLAASLAADLRTVTLTTSSQRSDAHYTLTATGIADRAASANHGSSQRGYTYGMPGLVGYWRLDETGGAVAADTSGSGNHGEARGNPARVAGRIGGAFTFDGIDDHVSIDDTAVLDEAVSDSFTCTGWVRAASVPPATTTGNWAYTMFKGPNVRIHYDKDTKFAARTETGPGGVELLSGAFPPGSWHHLAMVVDNGARKLHLYVDGQPVAGSPASLPGSLMPAPLDEVGNWPEYYGRYRIGATSPGYDGDGDRNMFTGQIDDVRLYDRALAPAEILQVLRPAPRRGDPALPVSPPWLTNRDRGGD